MSASKRINPTEQEKKAAGEKWRGVRIEARISHAVHDQLQAYCDKNGIRMGTLFRELVTAFMREENATVTLWGEP